MAEIFVSYRKSDRDKVAPIVALLERAGWTTWWDTRIGAGERWDAVIEREIGAARCVLVVWSPGSVESHWVHTEAHEGLRRRILIPALIGGAQPPLAFRLIQATDFSAWRGEPDAAPARELIDAVRRLVGDAPARTAPTAPEAIAAVPLADARGDATAKRGAKDRAKHRSVIRRWLAPAAVLLLLGLGVGFAVHRAVPPAPPPSSPVVEPAISKQAAARRAEIEARPRLIAGRSAGAGKGCEYDDLTGGYYLDAGHKVFDDERFPAIAYKLDTPVFQDATGNVRLAQTLRFGQRLLIADPGEGTRRVRLKDASGQMVGWVDRDVMLCRLHPSADPGSGLFPRVVVRTDTARRGQEQAKKVYHSPDRRCEGGTCPEVGRFQWYFVYAEENDHYLIAPDANLGSSNGRLLGWLPAGDAYVWDTALALRPSEQLASRRGPNDAQEDYLCAFRDRAESLDWSNCQELLGGKRWFALDARMAVVKEDPQGYEVVFPVAWNPQVATLLRQGRFTGGGLVQAIVALLAGSKLDIPIMADRLIDQDRCADGDERCQKTVYEGVARAFVPRRGQSDDLVPEVLLSRDQLDKWIKLLDVFTGFDRRLRDARSHLVDSLLVDLGTVLQLDLDNGRVPLGQKALFAAGLPRAAQSVLLQYSADELSQISDCELELVMQYVARKREALNIVLASDGKLQPTFEASLLPAGSCPTLSERGKGIPLLSEVKPQPLNGPGQQTGYSVMQRKGNDSFFWIPVGYLP
jgi:hypothetical protein